MYRAASSTALLGSTVPARLDRKDMYGYDESKHKARYGLWRNAKNPTIEAQKIEAQKINSDRSIAFKEDAFSQEYFCIVNGATTHIIHDREMRIV